MKNLKVSSLFHWLYGAVMFLPILLLPVFMIYSHRHTIDCGTLEIPQNEVVDFNQIIELQDFTNGGLSQSYNGNIFYYSWTNTNYVDAYIPYCDVNNYDKYYVNANIIDYSGLDGLSAFALRNGYDGSIYDYINETGYSLYQQVIVFDASTTFGLRLLGSNTGTITDNFLSIRIMCFNLTQMFGSGNEPTIEQFNQWYSADYYDYTLSKKVLLKDVSTITYSDTDIMSQATYQLYNATDKYFNISQFFGFENLWDYMVLNWFGGNVTIYLRIFWQLLTYWLVVSIAWLIFDLFMYVPKLAHRWLDRSAIE